MPDKLTPEQRHKCMSHIRGKDTKPELWVRRFLYAHGYRYRLQERRLPGRPDITMRRLHTVIMVVSFALAIARFKDLDWSLGREVVKRVRKFYWYRSDIPVGKVGSQNLSAPQGNSYDGRSSGMGCEDDGDSLSVGFGTSVMAGYMLSEWHKKASSSRSNYDNNAPLESILREEDSYHDWACGHDDPYDCNNDDCY